MRLTNARDRRRLVIAGALAATVAFASMGCGDDDATPSAAGSGAETATKTVPPGVPLAGRPTRGPADAKLTIVEFLDFECPYCGEHARDVLPEFTREQADDLRYVVVNTPGRRRHPHAVIAARAGICAQRLGRYWPYHEILFDHQDALTRGDLIGYAQKVGLSRDRFDRCLDEEKTKRQLEADEQLADRLEVISTPTFFMNGQRLRGAFSLEDYRYITEVVVGGGSIDDLFEETE